MAKDRIASEDLGELEKDLPLEVQNKAACPKSLYGTIYTKVGEQKARGAIRENT